MHESTDGRLIEHDEAGASAWRESRHPQWFRDIGYRLEDVLTGHRYAYERKGLKPDDPGWHECSCGTWQGYWSGFEPHVADHLRALVMTEPEPMREPMRVEEEGA